MGVRARQVTLLCCLAAFTARAEEGEPKVGLIDIRATQGATASQVEKVRATLSSSLAKYRVDLVDDHPAVKAASGLGAEATMAPGVERARQRAKEGKKLFEDLDPQGAEAKFRQAADLFEANAGGLSSPTDLINTYLSLARVFFATEREVLARDIFKRVVQIQPDLVLDKAVYPPGMVSTFEDVKKTLLASPLGALSVASDPTPARVFLDGRDRGTTPLDLVNIPAGVHTLTVRRAGYAPWVRPVDVTTFRVDKLVAEMVIDRHPHLEQAFVPKGAEQKDPLGATLLDYFDDIAETAKLDVLLVGRAYKKDKSLVVEVMPYRRKNRELGAMQSLVLTAAPTAADGDDLAGRLLSQLAAAEWIPPLAARRSVEAGGGARDETRPFAMRVSASPAARVAGKGKNFPDAPSYGIRVGGEYRLTPRVLLSVETGYDYVQQAHVVLKDSAGNVAVSGGQDVQAIYTSIPFDVGARYYFGVSTLAPYATGTLGLRWDTLAFRDPLPFDEIKGSSGMGFAASAGAGVDYALGTRSALYGEMRLQAGTIGAEKASIDITTTPEKPDRKLPVDAGLYVGARLYLGYVLVF